MFVPANDTSMPNETFLRDGKYDRAQIMRAAVALARQFIEDERRCYRNRWSAELRYGGKVPVLVLPTWREAMSEALRIVWRKAREERAANPAVIEEIERVEIAALTIQCAERPSRAELAHLSVLQAHVIELRSPKRAPVAHVV
jgi:hypothetical protein